MENNTKVPNLGVIIGVVAHIVGIIGLFLEPRSAVVFAFPAGMVIITISLRTEGQTKLAWLLLVIQLIFYALIILAYIKFFAYQ